VIAKFPAANGRFGLSPKAVKETGWDEPAQTETAWESSRTQPERLVFLDASAGIPLFLGLGSFMINRMRPFV